MRVRVAPHDDGVQACAACGAAPLDDGRAYCSTDCYRAAEHVCEHCGAFTPAPMAHRRRHHPETMPEPPPDREGLAPPAAHADARPVDTTAVEGADADRGPHCVNCGGAVSQAYVDVFGDGTAVNGCADCLPRSVRYGEDRYGRTKAEAEAQFRDSG